MFSNKTANIKGFTIDTNLAYAIQQVTGESTYEILSYFYEIAKYVADDAAKRSKARHMQRNVILFYKETPISYRLRVTRPWNYDTHTMVQNMSVDIYFPDESSTINVDSIIDGIVEAGLGLSTAPEFPKFKKPDLKTPLCLKPMRLEQDKRGNK